MTVDITLRWAGATDADSDTDYVIKSDLTTSGTFVDVATQDATSPYDPDSTTLNGALTDADTTIVLTDGTDFSGADYIVIDGELILLGTKSTHTFTSCVRGQGSAIPAAHLTGATVYAAHESYTDSAVDFGTRNVIRYRVLRRESGIDSVGAELIAVSPTAPPTTNLCTVWGIVADVQGNPISGDTVTLTTDASGDYHLDTGEMLKLEPESTTTDTDGYFEFFMPRDAYRSGTPDYTIVVSSGETGAQTWTVATVPDQDSINYLET